MKKLLTLSFVFVLISSFSNQVHADINFYGKINVSLEVIDSKNANETDFQNNASFQSVQTRVVGLAVSTSNRIASIF